MNAFCVICMPPSHRRASTSKTKKLIIELYSSYNEISRAFGNTNCQSIGEYSKLISSKYSLNQLTYSVILNGNINVYGRTIKVSGNNYLLLIYYANSNYITYLNKCTSLQILDDSISTYINIFIHKHKHQTHTPNIRVLKNIQNTIDLLQTINAQTSHSSSQLVYWDNKCKNYTQQIIGNTPNKQAINTNIFSNNSNTNYDHNSKRYSDFFTHSKYKSNNNKRKNSFYASSNSQRNSINRNSYKWSRKSTTQIPQIDTIQTQTDSNEMNAYKLDAKYENKLSEIKREMIGLFTLCNELKLNGNDENESDNKQKESDIFNRDLISQSKTQSIAFTSNEMKDMNDNVCEIETSNSKVRKSPPRHRRSDKNNLNMLGNTNFGHHKTMSDVLIQFQSKYKEANALKIGLIHNLKGLLKEIENDILPSFDDESDSDSDNESKQSSEQSKQFEINEELKEKCFDWLRLLTIQMNVNDINNGLKLQKILFESMTNNNEYKEIYSQIYNKISKYLPYINSTTAGANTTATLTPYNTPNISRINTPNINTPNMSRSSSVNNSNNNNVRIIKEDFASEFNDNKRKRIRHNRGKSDISEVINDCSVELKQQFNDMMGTIGDDTQFKLKLTDLLVEIANNYTNVDEDEIIYENDNDTNENIGNVKKKKRDSLIIHPIKVNFVDKIMQLEKDIEINNKYFNLLPNWDFDPIEFSNNNKVAGNCVVLLAWHLIRINNYHKQFGISANKLINFLYQIQESYNSNNLYHNSYHSCDVINNIYWFINRNFMKTYLNSFQQFILLIAAAIHDVNHDGFNNSYHARTKSYLAIRYNDQSILENYHIAYSFKLMSSQNNCDWISDLKDEKLIEKTRKYFIQLILGTDMSFHKKHLNDMNALINKLENNKKEFDEDDIINLCAIILHACDIGNAAKKRDVCVEWAKRCIDEFRIQGDDELKLFGKENQLLFSRKHPLEKSQVGWINFVMLPYFNSVNKLLNNDIENLIQNLNDNLKKWGKYKEFNHEKKEDK